MTILDSEHRLKPETRLFTTWTTLTARPLNRISAGLSPPMRSETREGLKRNEAYLNHPSSSVISIHYVENGTTKNHLAFTDNIGSILSVMDENGTKVFDASYDAWGKQIVALITYGILVH
jgi:hypothetical protein